MRYHVLSTKITDTNYKGILKKIEYSIIHRKRLLISPLASHTLVKASWDSGLQKTLATYNYLYPDSQYVRWSIGFLYGKWLDDRVYGPELMTQICSMAERKHISIFFYGTTSHTLSQLKHSLIKIFPKIKISGMRASTFSKISDIQKKEICHDIIKSKATIIFVSLGSPLEQYFCSDIFLNYLVQVNPIIIMPVGAAFDFISKVKPQSPKILGNIGFEWLFRLSNEPGRLWKRYLIYGFLFIFLIFVQKIKQLFDIRDNIIII